MNKKIDTVFAVGVVGALAVCSAVTMFHSPRVMSEKENRELAQAPELTRESLFGGSFTTDFEAYAADQFFWRDAAVSLKADTEKAIGKKGNNGVYFCDDGYLIADPPPFDDSALTKNLEAIKQLDALGEYNITLAVVPTAYEILKDKLPGYAYEDRLAREQEYIRVSMEGSGVGVCDTTPILSAHSGEYIYYRTDHHQTALGSYYVYSALGSSLGYKPHSISEYSRETMTDKFYGTSWSKASLTFAEPDTIERFVLNNGFAASTVFGTENKRLDSMYAMERLNEKDKYSVFLDGNHALTVINSNAGTGKRLAVFKDSYAHSIAPFLAAHFDSVHLIDMRYYNDDIIRYLGENDITNVLVLYNAEGFMEDTNLAKAGDYALTSDYIKVPDFGFLPEQDRVDDDYFADAVFFGDSLVAGYSYSASIPAQFVCKTSVNTRTVRSSALPSGKTVMESLLAAEGVNKYYLMLGINEVSYNPPEAYKEDYRSIIKDVRAQNPESIIYLMSVLPIEHSVEASTNISKAKIDAYNEALVSLAEEEQCYYLNINGCLAEEDGYLRDGAASDGIHVGGTDHRKWEEYLRTHAVKARTAASAAQVFSLYSGGGSLDTAAFAADMLSSVPFKDNMSEVSESVAARMFELEPGAALNGTVYTSGGGTAEEFAVFECADAAQAEALTEKLRKRVESRKGDFDVYKPEEMPKLNSAFVVSKGNLAFMCISDDNSAAEAVINKY